MVGEHKNAIFGHIFLTDNKTGGRDVPDFDRNVYPVVYEQKEGLLLAYGGLFWSPCESICKDNRKGASALG